jgi:hypothetical protein
MRPAAVLLARILAPLPFLPAAPAMARDRQVRQGETLARTN